MTNRRFGWHSGSANAKRIRLTPSGESEFPDAKAGDLMYDSTSNKLMVYTGSAWETVTSAA